MLRIIDANLNRLGEGLRLLEDVARLLLDDQVLTEELKTLRHGLVGMGKALDRQLLIARDSEGDVGAFVETDDEAKRADVLALVVANSRRVQESLRVLEELFKLPSPPPTLDRGEIKRARFQIYALEKKLVSKLRRHERIERLSGLYVIMDSQALKGISEIEATQQAIKGGARVVQLRDKCREKGVVLPIARQMSRVCAESGALFLVNDHPDLALACDADGVHVGQKDLPVAEVRKILPPDKLVGCSTANLEEALKAESDGADYIGVGSIYPTLSKEDTRPAGLETLRRVKAAVSVPVVAIGGITEDNLAPVIVAGADCIAVISAVMGAESVEVAVRRLVVRIKSCLKVE